MLRQPENNSRWDFLRSDGLGALAAIFLGGFIAWTIFEIFLRKSWLCGEDEDLVRCAREWLSVFWTAIAAVGTVGALIYLASQTASARRVVEQKEIDDLKAEMQTANDMTEAIERIGRPARAPPPHVEVGGVRSEAAITAEDAQQNARRKYFIEVTRAVRSFYPRATIFFALPASVDLKRARSAVYRSASDLSNATRRLQEGLNMATVAPGDDVGRRSLLGKLLDDCEARNNRVSDSVADWRDAIFADIAARGRK